MGRFEGRFQGLQRTEEIRGDGDADRGSFGRTGRAQEKQRKSTDEREPGAPHPYHGGMVTPDPSDCPTHASD